VCPPARQLKGRAATGARLLFMVEVLKLLLQASFLRELGLPDTKIGEFVSRSRTVRMVKHLTDRIATTGGERSQPTELCPAHFMTPIYAAHGPTASRYWCAIIREI